MAQRKQQLRSLLGNCKIADRFRLKRRIDRLKDESQGEVLTKLIEDVVTSCEWVENRKKLSTDIVYPDLPISSRREEISKAIQENQVIVLAGETGSGKTTQLPKICLELGLGCKGLIGHTQPRRLAARTVASRIAEELDTQLGQRVGYQVRFHDQVSETSQVKLMTDGILLAETKHDRFLEQYEVLIIDEAHERSLNIDFLLGYIKRILPKRPDLKVIITSATIDLERFSKHFNNAPVIEVSGRTYPVDVLYRPLHEMEGEDEKALDLQQGVLAAVEELLEIDLKQGKGPQGDILVFLPGEREIRETADTLRKAQLRNVDVLPLYARLSLAEQNRVFQRGKGSVGTRIVLSTNVAETSLTVPGIKYVIDTGLARVSRYSYRSKVQRLPIEAISQASANQRSGRCGRVSEGTCIRLYSEEDFVSRPEFTDAEIRRTNLAAVILQMLSLKLGDISEFPFVDPPDNRYVNDGFKLLQELGAVDGKRNITRTGWQLSRLPIDPRLGRMVIEASRNNCLRELLIIASALSIQDPRERPQEKQQASDEKHRAYAHEESDFLTFVNLWDLYEEQRQELSQNQLRKYCTKHFLSYMRMREWRDTHRQLHLICKELKEQDKKFVERDEPASYEAVHKSLMAGLLSHMGFKQEKKEYLGARNRRFFLFPGSIVYKKAPKWVMAAEMVETSQLYARCIARIEPQWAEKLAPHLVKKSYSEPHWEKKRAEVVATEQVTLYRLIIIPKRKVSFGKIDQELSHEIFIRHALVEGELVSKAPFIHKNRQLLKGIEELEAKSRRKDLLVDEEQLYEFYRLRLKSLKGEHIVNGAGFEKWRKQIEQEQPEALLMQEEDILQRSADHVSAQSYPDNFKWDSSQLKLFYNFEPGTSDDGVTLQVPLPLLTSVPQQQMEWLVPGMLAEKCTAIIKGLPKQQRKHFVPVPNYVDAFVQVAEFGVGDLYEALAHQLLRMTGIRIQPAELRAVELPAHLNMNLRLVNEKGRLLDESRDWEALNAEHASEISKQLTNTGESSWGRQGIVQWDFGQLEPVIKITKYAGMEVDAFPALADEGENVRLCLQTTAAEAEETSVHGIIRLALLNMKEQVRFARKQLQGNNLTQAVLYSGGVFSKDELEKQIIWQACRQLLQLDNQLIRDQDDFSEKLIHCKSHLVEQCEKVFLLVFQAAQSFHSIQKQLKGKVQLSEVAVLNDIKSQLSELFAANFLKNVSYDILQNYPRYLKGIELRLEKFRRNLRQECLWSEQLKGFMDQYQKRLDKHQKQGVYDPELNEFRWMIEEYRVSLFAQQLGTRKTVSEKRLKQQWVKVLP
ncbi:ATP-dependent RNA helicase HrpA [Neptuniibacter sp.]|uniref:ATP-dependent RNA helicase HrpA n=1 Tax=Neptuniibacter sp. TaxID=1962643 RepID=UPI002631E22A|nr:ATP-dependent RNA helicase HrpA [Neptuniibacter sp.]MCP4595968.1 ATP-dependent RNA helicase HrpA [Neptuniibacter sp.]